MHQTHVDGDLNWIDAVPLKSAPPAAPLKQAELFGGLAGFTRRGK